jgi:POU domain transcription factor, class 4
LFGGIEDTLFAARAEALADISKATHHMTKQDNLYIAAAAAAGHQSINPTNLPNHHLHTMTRHTLENISNEANPNLHHHHHHHHNVQPNVAIPESSNNPFYNAFYASHPSLSPSSHQLSQQSAAAIAAAAAAAIHQSEIDIDPRELESFAEKFKQRRIKLGVTQADVGQQLSKLKLPGVGALSQSTICRFESLTLSHNNMIALKPILHSWLEQAEADARNKRKNDEIMSTNSSMANISSNSSNSISNVNSSSNTPISTMTSNSSLALSNSSCNMSTNSGSCSSSSLDRKRKRTSIAAPEKRSLEAFFSIQPRPSGEKIAQIAEKLDLKKNVVRVWFCNQRQKQKRMKFAAIQGK